MANKHLSYRQFKNIFGDLGVTAWTKYNWLSNGLPDGEYNGITKLTINELSLFTASNSVAYTGSINYINVPTNNDIWKYGFSNYEIESANSIWLQHNKTCIGLHSLTNNIVVHIEGIEQNLDSYNAYLKEHPIILYYYDRRMWGGVIINSLSIYAGVAMYFNSGNNVSYGIRDVKGEYEYIGNVDGSTESYLAQKDMSIGGTLGNTANIIIQDLKYKVDGQYTQASVSNILRDKFLRAVVYKLSSTQALSLAPQSLDEPMEEPKVVEVVKEEKHKDVIFSLDNI